MKDTSPAREAQQRRLLILVLLASSTAILLLGEAKAQSKPTPPYPKEIRGYKVERTVVEIKKPKKETKGKKPETNGDPSADWDVEQLIQFGTPQLSRITPLGITLEIPIIIAPVKQSGHVEFLLFEDMVVNGSSVEVEEYHHEFDLPNKQPLTLHDPLSFYISLPGALLAAADDWNNSKETWPVTGRVYVFGKFKRGWFSGKRVVPVELTLKMRNPLRTQ